MPSDAHPLPQKMKMEPTREKWDEVATAPPRLPSLPARPPLQKLPEVVHTHPACRNGGSGGVWLISNTRLNVGLGLPRSLIRCS